MPASLRKIVILTEDMVMFNALGTRWVSNVQWSTETGTLATTVEVLAENPNHLLNDQVVASFTHVQAVYFDNGCSLVKPEDN